MALLRTRLIARWASCTAACHRCSGSRNGTRYSGCVRHADLIESRHDLRPFQVVGENVVTAAGTDHHRCAGILVRCRSINGQVSVTRGQLWWGRARDCQCWEVSFANAPVCECQYCEVTRGSVLWVGRRGVWLGGDGCADPFVAAHGT